MGLVPRLENSTGNNCIPSDSRSVAFVDFLVAIATSNPASSAARPRSRKCEQKNQSSVITNSNLFLRGELIVES